MSVLLGLGNATGMFYHAPAGTALPTYPSEQLAAAWKEVGLVGDAGLVISSSKSTTNIKNWANQIARVIMTDHSETAKAPIIDTSEEALKAVLGAGNVTTTAASGEHGKLITASLSNGALPPEEAFLFLMKDGDNEMMVGCTNGQIMAMDDITFAPGSAITWNPTITALGDGFKFIVDNGQTS
ncbi:MAG: hypothetical protein HUJ70_08705 [Pseudobutyrivibrio sp.]|nr:hypothetical protein [Pseudobutyrivibrio sp.]